MSKIGIFTAVFTAAAIIIIVEIAVPGIVRSHWKTISISAGIAGIAAFTGLMLGMRIRKRNDDRFRTFLNGLELKYTAFYGILYAYGKYRGLSVCFKYGRIMKSDLAPDIPGMSRVMALCRFKIPGTEHMKMHCALFAEKRTHAIRKTLGWENPESGFYISKKTVMVGSDVLDLFSRLTAGTRDKLRSIAARTDSIGIAPDWETVMIGRHNALFLAENDEGVLAQLDLQAKIPMDLDGRERDFILNEVFEAAEMISRDLR